MLPEPLRAQLEAPGVKVMIFDCNWPRNYWHKYSIPLNELNYYFTLSLTPQPRGAMGRFEGQEGDERPLGELVFYPADVPLWGHNDGGRQTLLACEISKSKFRSVVGSRRWTDGDLCKAMDLKNQMLRGSMKRLANEAIAPRLASKALVEGLVNVMLVDLVRSLGQDPAIDGHSIEKGGLTPRQLRQIESRIAAEELGLPTVAELAALLGISCRHLLRGYRQATGSTMLGCLQEVQRRRAINLVAGTDMPMKLIAERLGFRSQSSFSTAFQNAVGTSPTAYRHAARAGASGPSRAA